MTVTYGLAEYKTGDHIQDLPVLEGASWAVMLNKPDQLSCDIDMRDADVRALDIPSTTEPKKTVLFAQADNGVILGWGVIADREWNDDERRLTITASGGWQYFNQRIIAPPAAATAAIIDGDGKVVETYDTKYLGTTLGSIGIKLVEQALSWPGAPVAFVLPATVAGTLESDAYRLVDYKRVGAALDDLVKRVGGPDFAFDARRNSTGLGVEYVMRVGDPFLGAEVGSWSVGGTLSPVSNLKVTDSGANLATHVWMQSGRTDSKVLVARTRNEQLLDPAGYPVLDLVDTKRTDVTVQSTLNAYAAENAVRASALGRSLSFSVKGDASLALGQYRPGDYATLEVAAGNLYLAEGSIPIRILGISGDETGTDVKITCQIGRYGEEVDPS